MKNLVKRPLKSSHGINHFVKCDTVEMKRILYKTLLQLFKAKTSVAYYVLLSTYKKKLQIEILASLIKKCTMKCS